MKTLSGGGLNMPSLQISQLDGVPLIAQQLQKYELPSCSQIDSQRSTKLVSNDVDYASSRLKDENKHHICLGSRRQDLVKGCILFSRGSARIMKCKYIEWLQNIFIRSLDSMLGGEMRRGISGGQRRRLTTGLDAFDDNLKSSYAGHAIPAFILKIPLSAMSISALFFGPLILLFAMYLTSISTFRFLASVCQTLGAAMAAGGFAVLVVLIFGGFVITHPSMHWRLKWGFRVFPISYGERGLFVNEFFSPQWQMLSSHRKLLGSLFHGSASFLIYVFKQLCM
ncbi:hypothetical protein Patl1_24580 [Pistacia atlantica]|uniref:Uncharacterized protein n=1 Tax=Pistacia atlantica TaxID=434234 RepID=A0ACC1A035_9ROSI|nr:hypothetical protein Patl1_24580 [Pistacia atlantica]